MTDTEPLLKPSNKQTVNDDENKDKTNILSFSYWRKCCNCKKDDSTYIELKDHTEQIPQDQPVSILKLFQFATRLDWFLMFLSIFFLVVHGLCVLLSLYLIGRLTGLFAVESFGGSCIVQQLNLTSSTNISQIFHEIFNLDALNEIKSMKGTDIEEIFVHETVPMPVFKANIMRLVYTLFVIGALQYLGCFAEHVIWNYTIKRQMYRMNIALFKSLLQRNIQYWDANGSNHLNTKLFDNIKKIEKGLGMEFLMMVAVIACILVSIIVSLIVNWQLTLIMLCLVPIVVISSFLFSTLSSSETIYELTTYARAGQVVQEVFSSLRTVLSFNGGKFEQKRYEQELTLTRAGGIRQGILFGVFAGWLVLLTYATYAIGFIFGAILMAHPAKYSITVSDILVIVSIFSQCLTFFSFVGPFTQSFAEARGAAAAVFRLIEEGQDDKINEKDVWNDDIGSHQILNGDIKFDQVNFAYPARTEVSVLNNLSLTARAGQTTALVGSSGSGKSTCISLFLRYYEPSSGTITIDGQPIKDYNVKQLRENIGVVSQEPMLFGMSIYENIRFGKVNATRAEIEEAAREANAHDFIMKLPDKYETLVGERGIQLSGGEKQRIALARALVKKPTFLLLDEATSALDNVNERLVQDALDRACKGRTTIVIAHRLTTVQNADQIFVLDKGCVVEQGTHETLMAIEGGKYQELVKRQQLQRIDDDDQIESMDIEKVKSEDEQIIVERTRLISDSQITDTQEKTSKPLGLRFVFWRLIKMNSSEWLIILVGCIACLISGAAQPFFAVLYANVVDEFKFCAISQRRTRVIYASLAFLLLGGILLVISFVNYTAFAVAGSRLTQRIRSKAFECLLRQEVAYFDKSENSSGAIGMRLSSDATAVQEMVGTRLAVVCEGFALSFFGLLFGCLLNWQLTLIVFGPMIILVAANIVEIEVCKWQDNLNGAIFGQASTLVVDAIQNMRTVKQLSIETEVLQQYSNLIYQSVLIHRKTILPMAAAVALYWAIEPYTLGFVAWRAVVLVEHKKLTSHNIIIVLGYAMFALQALQLVGILTQRIASCISAADNFFELFDRKPVIDNGSDDGIELTDFRGEIKFDQVKFIYPARPESIVLNNFELNIKSSQRVALVGRSGCGKSTTIQLLERFYNPTKGQILLDGTDIRKLNIQWVRAQLGLVSQEPVLFDLTIGENIAYGLENVSMEDIISAAVKANIHDFIERLPERYDTKVGLKGGLLSGGEKQRIAIARVLIRRPKVLLLDEATSAMDSHNEQIVQDALDQAQAEDPNRTSLIIAHRLSTIRTCDSICVIDKGKIIESGNHGELTQRRGAYYKMLTQNQAQ